MGNGVDFKVMAVGLRAELTAAKSELAAVRRRESLLKEKLADCEKSEAALREELAEANGALSVANETLAHLADSTQAAEQRNSELAAHLTQAHKFVEATYGGADNGMLQAGEDESTLWNIDKSKAALQPTESEVKESRAEHADPSCLYCDGTGWYRGTHCHRCEKPTESGASE